MSDAPVVTVAGFDGTLDVLLEMAQAQQIDLRLLSVLAVVEALAGALDAVLRSAADVDLTRWGEWFAMGAQIALWRSRLLLPPGSAEVEAAAALRRQLLDREAVRRAAMWLEARLQVGRDVFSRGRPEPEAGERATVGDVTELFQACLVALRVAEQERVYAPAPAPLWRVSDAAARISRLLAIGQGGELAAFLPPVRGELARRAAVASTLVAGLELCRGGDVSVRQEAAWAPVWVSAG